MSDDEVRDWIVQYGMSDEANAEYARRAFPDLADMEGVSVTMLVGYRVHCRCEDAEREAWKQVPEAGRAMLRFDHIEIADDE